MHTKLSRFRTYLLAGVVFTLILGAGLVPAFGQTSGGVRVSGVVEDTTGAGIAGVTVREQGTGNGVLTESDGTFRMTVSRSHAMLEISSIGYISRLVAAAGKTRLVVTLHLSNAGLAEVVVVGYGTQKRQDVTGAVASVQAKDFNRGYNRDAAELIKGKVAGLTISSPNGDPTGGSEVFLRGVNTLTSNQSPLVLIDGVPGNLNTVSPDDIARIDVLKDGASAAIYGTRATNGVILITTKKADGTTSVTYNGYLSTQQFVKTARMLTPAEFRADYHQQGVPFVDYGGNTDWQKAITRSYPISHSHDLTVKGGNDKTSFLANLNYKDLQGMYVASDNRRIIARLNVRHSMFDGKLRLNLNYLVNNYKYHTTGDGASFNQGVYNAALISNPTLPVYKSQVDTAVLASMPSYDGPWAQPSALVAIANPLSSLREASGVNTSQTTRIYGTLRYDPFRFLAFNASLSTERYNQVRGYMETFDNFITTVEHSRNGYASRGTDQTVNNLAEFYGDYHPHFGGHSLSVMAGYGYQSMVTEDYYMQNWNFPTDAFDWNNMGLGRANSAIAGQPIPEGSSKSSYNLISFFGRVNYNYQDRFLAMLSVRHEADSRFLGSEHPWGTFPAVSVGWNLNHESFLKNVKAIDQLKLRAGYGMTGVSPNSPYLADYRLGYSGNNNSFYYNGDWVNLLQPQSNPNPAFTWEKKGEFNVGVDFSLFSQRLYGSVDAYSRKVTDLLYNYPVPVPPNLYGNTYANVGTMKNKGLEILVNAVPVKKGRFAWTTTVTFSTNKNTMGRLNSNKYSLGADYFYVGSAQPPINGEPTNIVQVGQPIGQIWGWKAVDISSDGKWIYRGKDGEPVPSDKATPEDRQVLGNGIPRYFAGWNNTFRYGGFDLGITMRGQFDYQIINFTRMHLEDFAANSGRNVLKSAFDKVFGKAVLTDQMAFNSYYVENGDFWKIDNITLGYTFKPGFIKGFKGARIYLATDNTFCITGYKGLDPEIPLLTDDGLAAGTDDWYRYPPTRTFTLGINFTL